MRYQIIDALRGTRTMPAYKNLCNLRHSADEVKRIQAHRLEHFLLSIKAENPLYSQLLGNVSEEDIHSNPTGVLSKLPAVDKGFINRNRERLFSPVSGRKWQHKKTGGSTGEPFRYAIDLESISESWAFILQCWNRYAGYRPGDPYITVAGSSLGATGYRLKAAIYQRLQNNYLISADVISKEMRLDCSRIKKAKLAFCYPSSMVSLLESKPEFFNGHKMGAVFTTSEQLLPGVRQLIEERLQVPVFDIYGANDGGVISCECEQHDGYHYDPFNCYIETEQNCDTGQNELLLTSLASVGFPFVRYRVGDIAELSDFGSCSCGKPFPLIRNLSGRTRDVLKLPDGRSVHGVVFNRLFGRYPEVCRYRVVQSEDYSIAIMLDVEDFSIWCASQQRFRMEKELIHILDGASFDFQPLEMMSDGNCKLKLIECHVV